MFRRRELRSAVRDQIPVIADHARAEGLDFFDTIFEMVNFAEMSMLAAFGGFPRRYPHWTHGMEFERMRKQQKYGLGKIYEMVINNDPCYAYLLDDNSDVDHKTVVAHVYAHCDFFKNNLWFSQTDRNMMNGMANHATRVHRHIAKVGQEKVEKFIDDCMAIDNLIDPYSVFMKRVAPPKMGADDEEPGYDDAVVRYDTKGYMDRYINPPEKLQQEREAAKRKREKDKKADPPEPRRDIMLFLLNRAPLEDWQADILAMLRKEAYYFAPQGQTKILNEGWATYWHSTMMTRYILQASELITYADHHAGTVAMSPGQLNPYKVGLELLRDIEDRWNRGAPGKEYDECENIGQRRVWGRDEAKKLPRSLGLNTPGREKIFEVRQNCNDITFIDNYLTPEFVDRHKLYHYRRDKESGRMIVVNRDFDTIKQQFLFQLDNHSQPYIFVVDANYGNAGELCLAHGRFCGIEVDQKWAMKTVQVVQRFWGRPVNLFATIQDQPVRLRCKDQKSEITAEKVTEGDIPEPQHKV